MMWEAVSKFYLGYSVFSYIPGLPFVLGKKTSGNRDVPIADEAETLHLSNILFFLSAASLCPACSLVQVKQGPPTPLSGNTLKSL